MHAYSKFYGEPSQKAHEDEDGYRWQSLAKAAAQQSIAIEGQAHRALSDCLTTLAVLKRMAGPKGVRWERPFTKFSMSANVLWRAYQCTSRNPREPREFLKGVFIGANGDVVGADGAIMYRAKNASLSTRDIVLRPQNDIPRAADNVFVEEHASGLYMLTFTGPNGRVIRVIAEEIASTYVAYERLFTQFEPTAIQGIAVDPRYVSLATKLWPEGIRMTFSGAEKPILVQSIGRTESMLIMPKKVPN
jgi:hypothetical protein